MSEAAVAEKREATVEDLQEEILGLKKEVDELKDELEEAWEESETDSLRKGLEIYADPNNWTGHTFTPRTPLLDPDPFGTASAALDGRPL